MELGVLTYKVSHHNATQNNEDLFANLDRLAKKKKEQTRVKEETYKRSIVKSYSKRVKHRSLSMGDLVLRKVILAIRISKHGKLATK